MSVVLTCVAIPSAVTLTIEVNPANVTDTIYIDSIACYVIPALMTSTAQAALDYYPIFDAPAGTST